MSHTPDQNSAPQKQGEEALLREKVLPELLSLQREAESKGSGADETLLQLGDGTRVSLEKYIRNVLFHYAHVIDGRADAPQKWQDMLETVRQTDPFTAGTIAAAAIYNIDGFRKNSTLANVTLDMATVLGAAGIWREALDSSICTWLATTDEDVKSRAADITGAIIKSWETYQPPAGIENGAPKACRAFLEQVSQNPKVRTLIEALKPGIELPPLQKPAAPPAAGAPKAPDGPL